MALTMLLTRLTPGLFGLPAHTPILAQFDARSRAITTAPVSWIGQSSPFRRLRLPQRALQQRALQLSESLAEGVPTSVNSPVQDDDLCFNSSMTEVGLLLSTRAVSRMLLPWSAI